MFVLREVSLSFVSVSLSKTVTVHQSFFSRFPDSDLWYLSISLSNTYKSLFPSLSSSVFVAQIREDWKYVAMVIDRLQLYVFFAVTTFGTIAILLDAPHIFEYVDQDKVIEIHKGKSSWEVFFLSCARVARKKKMHLNQERAKVFHFLIYETPLSRHHRRQVMQRNSHTSLHHISWIRVGSPASEVNCLSLEELAG